MSLQIWLPLIKDCKNYGLNNMEFSPVDSVTVQASNGKIANTCYQNTSHESGGLLSNKTINLGKNLTMCCWVNFSTLTSSSSLGGTMGGQHRYQNCTGMGLTFKYVSASTGYLSCNTGDGSNRTYNHYCGNTLLSAGNWYHVCFTYDGATIKFYVNGKEDGTHSYSSQLNVEDYVQVFTWSFGGASGASIYGGYKLNGFINDFRIYDNVLSEKEIKLISQGLALHYTMADKNLESTTNILTYPSKQSDTYSPGWDTSKHPGAIQVPYWGNGYNSGVSNPTIGYHAYWKIIDGISTMVFPNLNSEVGLGGRWLGINTYGIQANIGPSTTYTISFEAKGSVEGMSVRTGYYYRLTGKTSNSFHDGSPDIPITKQWQRYSCTFTTRSDTDNTVHSAVYFYGHYSPIEGISYIRNVQIEIKNHATGYTTTSRTSTGVYDCSGYGNNGTIIGNGLIIDYDTVKNSSCVKFDSGTAVACGRGAMIREALTVNIWGYMDNWSDYGGNAMRLASCTEGGGWNFEPNSSAMYFALGTGTDANTYKGARSSTLLANLSAGWHMFTGTYDGYNVKIYIDGKLEGTANAYSTKTPIYYNASNAIFIGAEAGANATTPAGSYLQGKISDTRIYGTALSEKDILELYQTSASMTNTGIIFANEFNEDAKEKLQIKKNNTISSGSISEIENLYDMEIKSMPDGSAWARIFYHKNNGGTILWTSYNEIMHCTSTNKYSRLDLFQHLFGTDGTMELMLTFPISFPGQYNRWKQTWAPDRCWMGNGDGSAVVPGYQAIHIDFNTNYWGGLARQTEDTQGISPCFLSGSVGHSNWFFAIGATQAWNGTVPGPNSTGADDVEIWARIDNLPKINKIAIFENKFLQGLKFQEW